MKKLVYVAVALAVVMCIAVAQEKPWFDLKNCAFCKQLDAQPDLVKHMNSEYHNIEGGFLSITHVDKEFQEAYMKAQQGMQQVAAEMGKTGTIPPMCQHCSKYGEFLMSGVRNQMIHSAYGEIFMMTSPDTAVVTKLQAFATRSAEEMAKFKAELIAK